MHPFTPRNESHATIHSTVRRCSSIESIHPSSFTPPKHDFASPIRGSTWHHSLFQKYLRSPSNLPTTSKVTSTELIRYAMPMFVYCCALLFLLGVVTTILTVSLTWTMDQCLAIGAFVSFCFSVVVIICYYSSRVARVHPNPIIVSKSLIDLILAMLYMVEYLVTELSDHESIDHLDAVTQALLVCGEFWFFAIPMDLLQSVNNPFTSYSYNLRVYWFYAVLSGAVCGLVLFIFGNANGDLSLDKRHAARRFFWFYENTKCEGFVWVKLLSYHVWIFIYLIFGCACIVYVRRRLIQGLEETIEIRKRVLTNGLLTCCIYTSWSILATCMFAITNSQTLRLALGETAFRILFQTCAFIHSARGCLNIIVWIVINAPDLSRIAGSSHSSHKLSTLVPNVIADETSYSDSKNELEKLLKPELNTALRKQMIQMATTGIIDSVNHYHRLHFRILSNQTFHLDWQRQSSSKTDENQPLLSHNSISKLQIVNVRNADSIPRFAFLPMAMKEMQFYDFQPRVFASIRDLFAIQDSEYVKAFQQTINERISEGRSGAFIFNSGNSKYTVKSMTAQEMNALLELLPSLVRYMKWNPTCLLPRFYGLHAMKMYGQLFYFCVMGNFLSTCQLIHRRYDIKGSWIDRNAAACVLGEKYRCSKCNRFFRFGNNDYDSVACVGPMEDHYPDITLRDNDLKKRLKLHPKTASQLVKQITRDTEFLASVGIMDYSLLIGVHYSRFRISNSENGASMSAGNGAIYQASAGSEAKREISDGHLKVYSPLESFRDCKFESIHCYDAHEVAGPSIYYFGIIDVLQKWTTQKKLERAYKVLILKKDGRGISALPPAQYASRFQQKMRQLFLSRMVQ